VVHQRRVYISAHEFRCIGHKDGTNYAPVPHMFSTYNDNGLGIDSITVIAKRGLYAPPTGIPVDKTLYPGQALPKEAAMLLTAVLP
jgi:hypothetical protein